jgi:hypothetical protein
VHSEILRFAQNDIAQPFFNKLLKEHLGPEDKKELAGIIEDYRR